MYAKSTLVTWLGRIGTGLLLTAGAAAGGHAGDYPERDITAVIPFGAGGGTDTLARAVVREAEAGLGKAIVVQNKPGATGAVATEFVNALPADGYTLLLAAENQNLYRTTGLSKLSFHDFEPILLLAEAKPLIVALPEARWKKVGELLDEAEKSPGAIKVMTTGPVGISGVVSTMLGKRFNLVPYKGEALGLAGLLGGHVDIGIVSMSAVKQYVETGKLKVLSLVSDKKLDQFPDWSALGQERPELAKFLPWGPYYGVYVKKGTPEPIIATLRTAFVKAWSSEKYQAFLKDNSVSPLGLTGAEAIKYQNRWESVTNWLLFEGKAATDPTEFGIPKI